VPNFRAGWLRKLVVFTPPAWLLALALVILGVLEFTDVAFAHSGPNAVPSLRPWLLAMAGLLVLRVVAYVIARQQLAPAANSIAGHILKIRRFLNVCAQMAEQRHQQDQERIKNDFENTNRALDQEYKRVIKETIDMRGERPLQLDEKAQRVSQHNA